MWCVSACGVHMCMCVELCVCVCGVVCVCVSGLSPPSL